MSDRADPDNVIPMLRGLPPRTQRRSMDARQGLQLVALNALAEGLELLAAELAAAAEQRSTDRAAIERYIRLVEQLSVVSRMTRGPEAKVFPCTTSPCEEQLS